MSDPATIIALKLRAIEILAPVEKAVINLDTMEIKQILPHREQNLLLDSAVIYPDRIVGRLEVGLGRCVKFHFKKGLDIEELVIRGTELIDMAAQLLGVRGSRFQELMFKKQEIVLLSVGKAEFLRPVKANDLVEMGIPFSNIHVWQIERNKRYLIEGVRFEAKVSAELRAVIHDIKLMSTA